MDTKTLRDQIREKQEYYVVSQGITAAQAYDRAYADVMPKPTKAVNPAFEEKKKKIEKQIAPNNAI